MPRVPEPQVPETTPRKPDLLSRPDNAPSNAAKNPKETLQNTSRAQMYKTEFMRLPDCTLGHSDLAQLPCFKKVNPHRRRGKMCLRFDVGQLRWLQGQVDVGAGLELPEGSMEQARGTVAANGEVVDRKEALKLFNRLTSKQLSRLKPCKLGRIKQWNVGDIKALLQQGKKLDMATCPPEAQVEYHLPASYYRDDDAFDPSTYYDPDEEYSGPPLRSAFRFRGCAICESGICGGGACCMDD